jgi:RNA polymerase sigma-70 factor (ECF subfamily)
MDAGRAPIPVEPRAQVEVLARRHHRMVYRYCRRMLGNDADALDASQTVFLQALESLRKGSTVENAEAWLRGISRNRCLDRLRRRVHIPIEGEELEWRLDEVQRERGVMTPSDPLTSRALEDCLDTLDERSRAVLLLRFHDDLPYEDISAILGDSPGALRVRVARSLPLLRRCLKLKGVTL